MAKYILLDTETTGTEQEDRIIQLGFLVLDGVNTEVHNQFFSTSVDIKIPAMETHGITPEMLEGKPNIQDSPSFKRLQELNTQENYLVIHNAPFDIGMLQKEGFEPQMQIIDTLRVAKHIYKDEEAHRLQYFRYKLKLYQQEQQEAQKLGVEIKAHDAIGDVLVLKLFLTQLRKEIQKLYPQKNPVEMMVELTNTPVFISKFKFGKYKNKTLQEVAHEDSGYLRWMLKGMENLDEDLRYSINSVLEG